jgi:hypothetical protein
MQFLSVFKVVVVIFPFRGVQHRFADLAYSMEGIKHLINHFHQFPHLHHFSPDSIKMPDYVLSINQCHEYTSSPFPFCNHIMRMHKGSAKCPDKVYRPFLSVRIVKRNAAIIKHDAPWNIA